MRNISFSQCLSTGSRSHMEDFALNYVEYVNGHAEFCIFGVFDGHGGPSAAQFVKEVFVKELKQTEKFWSNNNDDVKDAILEVFARIQDLLWIERENWDQTFNGYKCTSGTTATVAILRNEYLFFGNVGDSTMVMATVDGNSVNVIKLTEDHKPENDIERHRIQTTGGTVINKCGTERVVWLRKRIRQNAVITENIPFLAVSRSLGDLWSFYPPSSSYHVSPVPDVGCIRLDPLHHHDIIIGSDGLWNMVSDWTCSGLLSVYDKLLANGSMAEAYLPAQLLVDYSLHRWAVQSMKSDNVTVQVVRVSADDGCNQSLLSVDNCLLDEVMMNIINDDDGDNNFECVGYDATFVDGVDFTKHSALRSAAQRHFSTADLLQKFVRASENGRISTQDWSSYIWDRLAAVDSNFPLIASRLEELTINGTGTAILFTDRLQAFPWSISCLDCLKTIAATDLCPSMKIFFEEQPLLCEFWTAFYGDVIKEVLYNGCDVAACGESVMRYVIGHQRQLLQRFFDRYNGDSECNNEIGVVRKTLQISPLLKRSQTETLTPKFVGASPDGFMPALRKCLSEMMTSTQPSLLSASAEALHSGSSTPPFPISSASPQPSCRPTVNKRKLSDLQLLPFVKRRTLSTSVAELLLVCKPLQLTRCESSELR